jgi:hypothetical protein
MNTGFGGDFASKAFLVSVYSHSTSSTVYWLGKGNQQPAT